MARPSSSMILALVNTLVVLGALGTVVYTKVLYKRAPITESAERVKLESSIQAGSKLGKTESSLNLGIVTFDPINATISPDPGLPGESNRVRYANINFSLEIKDNRKAEKVTNIKVQFLDSLLNILGKKRFGDLTTVQGRYVLRSEMISAANKLLKEDLVTNVFFIHYMIQ
ncbi:MAG: flagellar basal body-associated FliL family protein [Xanthomonadaceae bacterium]|nr:flagellar basal body-associated FliL family protein [Xanthomonadaceae bacterium]